MKYDELLKQILIKGGPAAIALASGKPELAAVFAAASAGGDVSKIWGRRMEKKNGWRPHKIVGPTAAVGAATLTGVAIGPGVIDQICGILIDVCDKRYLLTSAAGLAMVLWHVLSSNVGKVRPKKNGV